MALYNLAVFCAIVAVAWKLSHGDIVLTMVFVPVIWMMAAILIVIIVPERDLNHPLLAIFGRVFD